MTRSSGPTWKLILEAAEQLTREGRSPFTLKELNASVQLMDPTRGSRTVDPIVQGMTINAPGGPKSACGEVLRRVDRGVYELLDEEDRAARFRSTVEESSSADRLAADDLYNGDPLQYLASLRDRATTLDEISDIVAAKQQVIDRYGTLFSPENLDTLTADEFKSFLLYENNVHWWGIHRHQAAITADMDHLRQVLRLLTDESRPIQDRLDEIVRPMQANLVRGLGKAVFTPILLVVYPDRYGVWNSIAESAMKRLGYWPDFARGSSFGEKYVAVNSVLNSVAGQLVVDLWTLDALWWAVEKESVTVTAELGGGDIPSVVFEAPGVEPDVNDPIRFSLERHLHDFLRDNWDRTELGKDWSLLSEGGDVVGYEYPTGVVGRIDLLARHRSEPRWLVVELKREQSSDQTVGQVARYVGWVAENLAGEDETVEGLVISRTGDDRTTYALSIVPGVTMKTYEVDFRLVDG